MIDDMAKLRVRHYPEDSVLEHEIDHLNGKLYFDHLDSQDKLHKIEVSGTARQEI